LHPARVCRRAPQKFITNASDDKRFLLEGAGERRQAMKVFNICSALFISFFIPATINCTTRRADALFNIADQRAMNSAQTKEERQPSPKLSPEDVVRIQLEALQHNDAPTKDAGIAIAFRFASPSNQTATGPLEKFILLVKNPLYRPMLNHKRAERAQIEIEGDQARQRVTIITADDERITYLFTLSKQADGQFKDCWMTDAVERLTPAQPLDPNTKIA
jgi:hypothetical protein